MNTHEKLAQLRQVMQLNQVDFCWVPSSDCHFDEYVPACWQRRRWLSGFSGSVGSALVGLEGAWLWTDSRYFLQAEDQLDASCWQLMRQGYDVALLPWLAQHAVGKVVAVDAATISMQQWQQWSRQAQASGVELKLLPFCLVDRVWPDQPSVPKNSVFSLADCYSGKTTSEKIDDCRVTMASQGVDACVVTALDSIAWLSNCRGNDIECNPVFIAYLILEQESATLYVDPDKMNPDDQNRLVSQGVRFAPYDQFLLDCEQQQGVVWVDPQQTSVAIHERLKNADLYCALSPITSAKAVKNSVEQSGMREAHRRDGLALVRFLMWLETHWRGLDEVSAAEKLLWFRQQDPHFKQMSFPTICGYADHGAIVHYSATPQSAHKIEDKALLLIDSGGQYDQGTTDVTRTLHLGTPTEGEKHHYTLVLKGHLALRHTQFPLGTLGEHLDAIARAPLWAEHLQYGHGTGHGVGCYLNVHEGPQRIAPGASGVALQAGMIVSNEPGVYFNNQYGIRIENLVLIEHRCSVADSASGHGPFLGFDDLTLVPYARNLIDCSLLSPIEIEQVNRYHENVYLALADALNESERNWLKQATLPL